MVLGKHSEVIIPENFRRLKASLFRHLKSFQKPIFLVSDVCFTWVHLPTRYTSYYPLATPLTANTAKTMSSRLCSMPPELLGEIFSHLTQLDPDSPFALRDVCRTFYNVVRCTPKIWTHLKLDIAPDSIQYCLAKSQVWFAMAGDCTVWLEAELLHGQPTKLTAASATSASWQDLPRYLSAYTSQISALTLCSTSADEAQIFLTSLYSTSPQIPMGHALRSLSLITASDTVSHRNSRSKAPSPISLPAFPHLRQLTLTNHLLPYLSMSNAQNLQALSLTYPLRFPPLSVFDLRHVLHSCPQLVRLELEARITDSPNSSSFPSSSDVDNSPEEENIHPDSSSQSSSQSSLISLPNLTHLQLRINNLPLLLGDLLVQNLDTLKIEDLDGKRGGADAETGAMLRQLLVRMELPSEDKRGQGLRSLELVGVGIPSSVSHYDIAGNGRVSGCSSSDSFGTWSWCFQRMRALKELHVSKVNVKSLLALIIGTSDSPRSSSTSHSLSTPGHNESSAYAASLLGMVDLDNKGPMPLDDRLALPSLETLGVTLSASASSFHAPAFLKLALQRPNINVHMTVVPEPPPVVGDFLAHYLS